MDRQQRGRLFRALGGLAGLLLAFVVVVLVLQPPCPILAATGRYCAGCGGQRMLLALLRGDFAGALAQNPYLFFALPLLGVYLAAEAARYVLGRPPLYRKRWVVASLALLAVLAVAFTLLRNLPGWEFLGPPR